MSLDKHCSDLTIHEKALELYSELTKQVITLCVFVITSFVAGLKLFDLESDNFSLVILVGIMSLFASIACGLLGYGRMVGMIKQNSLDLTDATLMNFGRLQQILFFVGTGLLVFWMVSLANSS